MKIYYKEKSNDNQRISETDNIVWKNQFLNLRRRDVMNRYKKIFVLFGVRANRGREG